MFAIFHSGGSQHRAEVGQVLSLQKLEVPIGDEISFSKVCLLDTGEDPCQIGKPWIEGVCVKAVVTRQYRDKKIKILKFRRRKHSMKHRGHRQSLTEVEITAIQSQKS